MTFAEALAELIANYREYTADDVAEALFDQSGEDVGLGGDFGDAIPVDWSTVHMIRDRLARAKRCLCSPHRGPMESLIHVEEADAIVNNLSDFSGC